MIKTIKNILIKKGLITKNQKCSYTVHFNRNFNFFIYPKFTDNFYQVKVSTLTPLFDEYIAQKKAYAVFNKRIPQIIHFEKQNTKEILICNGVKHDTVNIGDFQNEKIWNQLEYIQTHWNLLENKNTKSDLLNLIQAPMSLGKSYFTKNVFDRIESAVSKMPQKISAIKQHSDFVTINFGLTKKNVCVFDWEDYGKISVPGFDLCCFLFEYITYYNIKNFHHLMNIQYYPIKLKRLITKVCLQNDILVEQFYSFIPVYALCFWYLKKKYAYSTKFCNVLYKLVQETVNYKFNQ